MAVKNIERAYPGKSADQLYGEAEKILRKLGEKYGIACQFDAAKRTIVVPEKLGVKGLCTIRDGLVRVELTHGLLATPVATQVKSFIERKLDGIFT